MRVAIDRERCSGHGRCYAMAPELFVDDEAGYGHVVDDGAVPLGSEEEARRAAVSCPEQAVRIDQ